MQLTVLASASQTEDIRMSAMLRVGAGRGRARNQLWPPTRSVWCCDAGDLGDLIPALDVERQPAWHTMGPAQLRAELASRGKCSAMVKVTGAIGAWSQFGHLEILIPKLCRLHLSSCPEMLSSL